MSSQAEFQAVVLAAGKGSRMREITTGKPKCLLPVGSKPLVWYPLHQLEQSGFTDAILVVLETEKSEIQNIVERTGLEIRIDYCTISGSEDLGTADSLRAIQEKLRSDVLVVSCDFLTDVSLKGVLDVFRRNDASIASLLFHPDAGNEGALPGPKSKYKPERDLIGIDSQTNRLVFLASASDFENELTLPKALLKKHTNIKMYSNLIDSHVYVMKNWVVKFLVSESNFSTIKGELLPYIIKKQLAKPPKSSLDANKSVINHNINSDKNDDIFFYSKQDDFDVLIREMSSYNDHCGDLKPIYHGDSIRCYAVVSKPGTFGVRVNTLRTYWMVNNKISEKWAQITNGLLEVCLKHPKSDIKSSQVDDKCVIWEAAKLKEKTSFKNSIIGANTEVNSFSRVFNSIVMNNVTIKEKVALENCIVCDGATIESNCQIKGCIIGSNFTVPANSDHSNEVLTDSDQLMEF